MCVIDGYIYIYSMSVIYICNCMSHYVDFHAYIFRGDLSANKYSSDILNWFESLGMIAHERFEIYVCHLLRKFLEPVNQDQVYHAMKYNVFKVDAIFPFVLSQIFGV